jgi:N utilization substance protein B
MTKHLDSRRQAREAAVMSLFSLEFTKTKTMNVAAFCNHFDVKLTEFEFVSWLVNGFLEKKEEVDTLLEQSSSHWKLSRMGLIDRSILRCAIFENKESDTPKPVIINEYIEIAKRFGDEKSAGFINGVLDQVLSEPSEK